MIDVEHFREWLQEHTNYSPAVISNTVSRMKRADGLLPWYDDEVYQFYLERNEEYKTFTVSVRSQIKKAVRLYREFRISNS